MREIRSVMSKVACIEGVNFLLIVGRTPRSARVPLDPLPANLRPPRTADEGVGRGPGGPPHNLSRNYVRLASRLSKHSLS